MSGYFQKLSLIGTANTLDKEEKRRTQLLNSLSLAFSAISFPFFVFHFASSNFPMATAVLLLILFFGSTIVLNHFNRHNHAKFFFIITVDLMPLFFDPGLGYTENFRLSYLPLSCIPLLLLSIKQQKYIIANYVLSGLFFFILDFRLIPVFNAVLPPENWIPILDKMLIVGILISNALIFTYIFLQFKDQIVQLSQALQHSANLIKEQKRTQKELKNAKEKAEEGSRVKSEFLSTMSHEIRTPLNAVIGFSNLLDNTRLNEEQAEYVKSIKLGGESLLSVINDILDYSKIESGKLEVEYSEFSLVELIEDVFDLLSTQAFEKEIELVYFLESQVPDIINSDQGLLKQVLLNLVNNAVKFTESGEIYVHVSLIERSLEGHHLRIEVNDTGIGIPQNKISALFDSFSQVDSSTRRQYGGTGLGLAISQKIVHLLGGGMEVRSELKKGSTFSFTLRTRTVSIANKGFRKKYFNGEEILIIDDNSHSLHALSTSAQRWGLQPTGFRSSDEVLAHLKSGKSYEIIVMDFCMPGICGLELMENIRQYAHLENTPVIILGCTRAQISLNDKNKRNYYLSKPIRFTKLRKAIDSFFNGVSATPEVISPVISHEEFLASEHKDLRILLAEDNLINQKVAVRMLEKLGFRPDIANNGLEAVEAVKNSEYDLVLMDMQMPGMDGLEAAAEIIHLMPDKGKRPVIVALTANAMIEDRERCLNAGMDDFLTKPVTPQNIKTILHKWFHKVRDNYPAHLG